MKASLVAMLLLPAAAVAQQSTLLSGPVTLEIRSSDTTRVLRVAVDVERPLFQSLGVRLPAPGEVNCGPAGCVATTPATLALTSGRGAGRLTVADSTSEMSVTVIASETGERAVAHGRHVSFNRDGSGQLRIQAMRVTHEPRMPRTMTTCAHPMAPHLRTSVHFDRSNTNDPQNPYSAPEWDRFVNEVLVRFLPAGGSIYENTGWWRRPNGTTFRGIGRTLVVWAPVADSVRHRAGVDSVIAQIKTRYRHQVVFREEEPVCEAAH